jgi:hypothetical protein
VTRHQLTEHLSDILPPIQSALCDADPTVREAAGAAFGILFKGGAHGAVESVVPSLLSGLDTAAHGAQSLEGLRVILGVRPQVFHGIVPKLLKPPVSSAGLRALGQLASTAGVRVCVQGLGCCVCNFWRAGVSHRDLCMLPVCILVSRTMQGPGHQQPFCLSTDALYLCAGCSRAADACL